MVVTKLLFKFLQMTKILFVLWHNQFITTEEEILNPENRFIIPRLAK